VAHEHQGLALTRAGYPGDEIAPAGLGLDDARGDTCIRKEPGEIPSALSLVPWRIGGIDANKVAQDIDNLAPESTV